MMYPNEVDLEFDWHLTNKCNFNCMYCHPQIKRVLNNGAIEPNAAEIVQKFNSLNKVSAIHMSGGEPFLFPEFIKLCKGLTQNNYISLNTNLSEGAISEFGYEISPKKVSFINAAIHQLERERLKIPISQYITSYLFLQDQGFTITALYILHPLTLNRFIDDIKLLKDAGIKSISAKVFKGVYKGKIYPRDYSKNEKKKILSYSGDYKFNQSYIMNENNFQGKLCTAGNNSFKIEVDGTIHRCATIKGDYGNIYNGNFFPSTTAEPCTAKKILVLSQCQRYLINS